MIQPYSYHPHVCSTVDRPPEVAQAIICNPASDHKANNTLLSTMSPPIGVRFVSDEIKRDHRELEILYKGLVQAVDECDDTAAAALQKQFGWELARHLVAMQLFVFPGTEQRADEGNGKALRRRDDLAAVSCNALLCILKKKKSIIYLGELVLLFPECMLTQQVGVRFATSFYT